MKNNANMAGKSGKTWLRELEKSWKFEPEEREIARLAAKQLDIVTAAEQSIAECGAIVAGRYGPKANPAVEVARKAAETHAKLVKALKLARAPKRHVGRPSMNDRTGKHAWRPM